MTYEVLWSGGRGWADFEGTGRGYLFAYPEALKPAPKLTPTVRTRPDDPLLAQMGADWLTVHQVMPFTGANYRATAGRLRTLVLETAKGTRGARWTALYRRAQ